MNAAIEPSRLYTILTRTTLRQKDPVLYQLLYNLIGNIVNLTANQSGESSGGGGGSTTTVEKIIQLIDLADGGGGDDSTIINQNNSVTNNNTTNVNNTNVQQVIFDDTVIDESVFVQYLNVGAATATKVTRASNFFPTSGVLTTVNFTAAVYDTSGMWAVSPNPSRLTCKIPGKYFVRGDFTLTAGQPAQISTRIYKSGNLEYAEDAASLDGSSPEIHSVNGIVDMAIDDYIELQIIVSLLNASPSTTVTAASFLAILQSPQNGAPGTKGDTGFTGPMGPIGIPGDDGESDNFFQPSVAPQPNGLVLLAELTASASAALNFVSRNKGIQSGAIIQSDFDEYEIHCISLIPASNGTSINIQMSTDGGSTYDATSGHYSWEVFAMVFNASGANGSTSATAISLANNQTNSTGNSFCAKVMLLNALSTALYKLVYGFGSLTDSSRTTDSLGSNISGKYLVNGTAVNAFRIICGTGNITSGTVRVYGVPKQ